jgi:hypothetical protein
MARPEQYPIKKVVGFDDALVRRVDDWRRGQTPIPNFSEAVRALIGAGIEASLSSDVAAALTKSAAIANQSQGGIIEKAVIEWLQVRNMLPKHEA